MSASSALRAPNALYAPNALRVEAYKKCEIMIHHTNVEKEKLISKKKLIDGIVEPLMSSLADIYKETINGLSKMGEEHTDQLGGIMEKKYDLRKKYIELQHYLMIRLEKCDYIIGIATSLQKKLSSINSVNIEHTLSTIHDLYNSLINWDIELQVKYNLWRNAFDIARILIIAAYNTIQSINNVNRSNNKSSRVRFRNGNNVRMIPSRSELQQMKLEEEQKYVRMIPSRNELQQMKLKAEQHGRSMVPSANAPSANAPSANAPSGGTRRKKRAHRSRRNRA